MSSCIQKSASNMCHMTSRAARRRACTAVYHTHHMLDQDKSNPSTKAVHTCYLVYLTLPCYQQSREGGLTCQCCNATAAH